MPDEIQEVVDEQSTDEPAEEQEPQKDKPDLDAELQKWKAMARKHEAQAKANAEAAAKLKDIENAGKSETEKLQAALEEYQSKERQATIRALKLEVAAEKNMPKELAGFLPDLDNEVDMMEAADKLLAAAGAADKVDPPTRQPRSLNHPLGDETDNEGERLLNAMLGKPAR
jgi:uncharacterized protein (DUF885 family)